MSMKVGITGGIGSGKTTICKVFELLGIPVFYADDEAKKLMTSDPILIAEIKLAFGGEAYFEDATLNRKYIANIVFKEPEQLKKLNSYVHPAVFRAMEKWTNLQKSPYVLKEAALLFESDSYLQNRFNILVSSPLELRIRRVVERDQMNIEKVLERIENQFTEDKKMQMADYFIHNNEQEFIIPQILKLHQELLKRAHES